jgi:hypothetical protein
MCNYHVFSITVEIFTAYYNNTSSYKELPSSFGFKCNSFPVLGSINYAKFSYKMTYKGNVLLRKWEILIHRKALVQKT